jgi:pimeloyl-ACP methyl ester carboxylesterase
METGAIIEIDGLKTHYLQRGQGSPVLLLHGWGSRADHWRQVFDDLARHYAVTAVDLPGHGQSAPPPEAWAVQEYSAFVLKFMDHLKIPKAHFIGHSFGGQTAAVIAAANPERVEKLILVNASGLKPKRSLNYYFRVALSKIGKFVATYGGAPGQWLKGRLYKKIASADYANATPIMRACLVKIVNQYAYVTSVVPQIKASTLIIWGENDLETKVDMARRYHALIPGSKLVLLKDAGHYSYIDQFTKFRLHVHNHLAP